MEGFIPLNRSLLLEHPYYKKPITKAVLMHLLLHARFKDGRQYDRNLKRGQLITTLGVISEANGISESQAKTAIKHLSSCGDVKIQGTTKYTIYTMLRYDDWMSQQFVDKEKQLNAQGKYQKKLRGEKRYHVDEWAKIAIKDKDYFKEVNEHTKFNCDSREIELWIKFFADPSHNTGYEDRRKSTRSEWNNHFKNWLRSERPRAIKYAIQFPWDTENELGRYVNIFAEAERRKGDMGSSNSDE